MHSFNFRVYYEDTDAGGIVYHANYLKFAERARTEMVSDLGVSNTTLKNDHNLIIVVRHIDINYFLPAHLEDKLTVRTTVEDIGRTSFLLKQEISKESLSIATLLVKLVCIDSNTRRPVRVPTILKEKLQ